MNENPPAVPEEARRIAEVMRRFEGIPVTDIFKHSPSPFEAASPFIYAVERLTPELRAVLIQGVLQRGAEAAPAKALRDLLPQIRLDIEAAELGAMLHNIGNCQTSEGNQRDGQDIDHPTRLDDSAGEMCERGQSALALSEVSASSEMLQWTWKPKTPTIRLG